MDQRTFLSLELDSLIGLLVRHVQTALGRRRVLELKPTAIAGDLDLALAMTSESVEYLREGTRFGFGGVEDPEPAILQLQVEGASLEPRQILIVEQLISTGMELRECFRDAESRARFPRLSGLASRIPDLRRVLSEIKGKILPGGEVDDNASPELRAVRRELQHSRSRIHRSLEALFQSQSRAVQEEIVTFRNGRFVIPIRTDSRGLIPGVVHGLSSSGQTTFVEPLTVIEQNNDLVRLREQEEIEISRILSAISTLLRNNLAAVRTILHVVAELDFAQAKGLLALEFNCVRPRLSLFPRLILDEARHILLEAGLRKSGGAVVPVSLQLEDHQQVLVISGPNAGGKTVVLKTVGLIALMAQMGLHVPARQAILPIYAQIFADIGDQQSISANLSTFTAHIRNISEMIAVVCPPALLLIDEAGTGTDPDEGAALAVAILDYFRQANATTITTTHYHGVKMWSSQTPGVRNACVEFDEPTLRPTFRLLMDLAGVSAGIEIARRMNLPPSILAAARARLDPVHAQASEYLRNLKASLDEQESLRQKLEKERLKTAEEFARLDLDFAKREAARNARFEEAMGAALHEFTDESERLIRSLKDRVESASLKKAAANRAAELRRKGERLRAYAGVSHGIPAGHPGTSRQLESIPGAGSCRAAEISPGDRVKILSLNKAGIVESAQDGTYSVQIGPLRFKTDKGDLELLAATSRETVPAVIRNPGAVDGSSIDKEFLAELNVIGLTADEALDRVDKYMDEALLAGAESVRIIHGHGKGILRRAIAKYLAEHPQVDKFQLAPPEKGGGGATCVDLKK